MIDIKNRGFSLIEILIVVISIIFIIGITLFFFKIQEINKINRDTQRIKDLLALKLAIENQNIKNYSRLENSIYISLPDSYANCSNYILKLNKIYDPFSYVCQSSDNFQKTDGSGWIPINFNQKSIVNLNFLPVDPINDSQYFYAFQVKDNKYKLSAKLESASKGQEMINDGGINLTLYEVGTDVKFSSVYDGLVGFWTFDEQNTSTILDYSSYDNNGVSKKGFDIVDLHTTSTCKLGYCLRFNGINDYVVIDNSSKFNFSNQGFTLLAWINIDNLNASEEHFIINRYNWSSNIGYGMSVTRVGKIKCDFNGSSEYFLSNNVYIDENNWYLIACVYDGKYLRLFVNGKEQEKVERSNLINTTDSNLYIGTPADRIGDDNFSFRGRIDEVYLYNRPLSLLEINLIYQFRSN